MFRALFSGGAVESLICPVQKNYKKEKKSVDKRRTLWYNSSVLGKMLEKLFRESHNGGIAQLARAIGSYPIGRGFKSNFRYHAWQSLCQMMQFAGICSGPLVKRLRHRPFTAVTGVRFSHGSSCAAVPLCTAFSFVRSASIPQVCAQECAAVFPCRSFFHAASFLGNFQKILDKSARVWYHTDMRVWRNWQTRWI